MKLACYILIFTLSVTFAQSPKFSPKCLASLQNLFKEQNHNPQVQNILKLQGKLTLHRLAWASMYNSENDRNFKLENKIDGILEEMNSNKDPKFLAAKKVYAKNKLSRTGLARVLPYLKDVLNAQTKIQDPALRKKYMLQDADLKLLAILAEKEAKKNGDTYDHKLFKDKNSTNSILNFTTIINSSMRDRPINAETKKKFSHQIEKLSTQLHAEIQSLLLAQDCEVPQAKSCNPNSQKPVLEDSLISFLTSLDGFNKHKSLKYGDFWLHVNKKYVDPKQIKPRYEKMVFKKPKKKSLTEQEVVYFDHLATSVIDRYPYFVSKDELLDDKELLLSLSQALDKEDQNFDYKGTKYYRNYSA
ncbi:MAG: hypothetical protein HON90_01005 [Halobacteriovoraceae bacterium]|nr:hypothetical protein [Halobacteriovoraceae bacterium]